MTKERYDENLRAIKSQAVLDERKLGKEYAFSNSKVKIGDIIEDHMVKGEVVQILWTKGFGGSYPYCFYRCLALKKDGTPTKKSSYIDIHQTNLI